MAKLNALQEQLLKAGLTKKSKVAAVAREQGKVPTGPSEAQRDATRVREEKIERDRTLAAEHKAQRHTRERRAQARQIINDRKLPRKGEREYRFTAYGAIHSLFVDDDQAKKLASGALVIAVLNDHYELLPRFVGDQVRQRDAEMIVVDHSQMTDIPSNGSIDDDTHYARFEVPDDLVW